jgi:oligopeptide transport system substrate-binding protein
MARRSASKIFSEALFLCLLLLGGCAPYDKPADLRIINGKEPESIDPATVVGQPDGRVCLSIFEGLTRYNPTNAAPEPGLAERWDISPDRKTYTFFLRTNALWSTGERITAQDFVYSWMRVLDPNTAGDYAGHLYYIKGAEDFNFGKTKDPASVGIRAVDERTLRVELVNPTPFFLDLCAFPTQAVVHRGTIEKYGDRWLTAQPLPCSGAYELVYWRLNDRIRVRKNRYYWEAEKTGCEVVDFMPVNSPNTALNLFYSGEVDVVWDKDVVPSELLDVLRTRPDFHTFNYLATYFFRYNVTRKPFDDVRVRQALALAIDKKRLTEKITRGGELAADFYVPPLPGYKSPAGLGYDPERARALLKEAGFEGGKGFPRFSYLFNSSRDHEKIAVELQEMWRRELGIDVELRSVEWKVYLRTQVELDYDLTRSSWIGDYTDPNTFLDMFMSNNPNNRTGWKSDKYDDVMRQANAESDAQRREGLLRQAEQLLIRDELPIVPLYIYVGMNFFDTNIISGIYNGENIRDEHPTRAIRKDYQAAEAKLRARKR